MSWMHENGRVIVAFPSLPRAPSDRTFHRFMQVIFKAVPFPQPPSVCHGPDASTLSYLTWSPARPWWSLESCRWQTAQVSWPRPWPSVSFRFLSEKPSGPHERSFSSWEGLEDSFPSWELIYKHNLLTSLIAQLIKNPACNAGDLGPIPGLGRSPGEGKGYPCQYSDLENSMDCIVHGFSKSQTQLNDFYFQSVGYDLVGCK